MPAAAGIVTVQVRVVTPDPTYVHCRYVVAAAPVGASDSQSPTRPRRS